MEPLQTAEESRHLSLVGVGGAGSDSLLVVKTLLNELKEKELRDFSLHLYEDELNKGYYLPSSPTEYKNDSRIAQCVGQSSVTIKNWYDKIRPFVPDFYLKDEDGKWRVVAIVELTDFGMACCDELPERDRNGKPQVDGSGKIIKIRNPYVKHYGWDEFYRPLLERRWRNYNHQLRQPNPSGLAVYKPSTSIETFDAELVDDDSWMQSGPLSAEIEQNQEGFQDLEGIFGYAGQMYQQLAPQYRQAGRITGVKLAGQFKKGIHEGQEASGLQKNNTEGEKE